MPRRSLRYSALGVALLVCSLADLRAANPAPIRIGMVQTFFNDVPKILVDMATEPFSVVMREATGLNGELVVAKDAYDMAKQIADGTMSLGVFHSFEFAWAQQKYPELKPLMVAVNRRHQVQAYLLTRKDSNIASFADLKGKGLSLPLRSKEHCRLYVKQRTYDAGQCAPCEFFQDLVASSNVETALDELCQGKIPAAVVDSLGLDFYRELKPGCFAHLKIVQESELFPPPVIAYKGGVAEDEVLRRVREGLLNANALPVGREMMKMWKVHAFEMTPDNYTEHLASILKAYPTPEPAAKVSRR
jgi:ABC-type phosphate/phosphonate transport system substrate-binding protein